MRRRLILFALFNIFYTITHAQYAGWMMGTWKSTNEAGSFTQTIQIIDVTRESFIGTKTTEINDGSHAKVTISISGGFRGAGMYLYDGEVLQKEGPENGKWHDCSACQQDNEMIVHHDSLILISSISDCDAKCDGETSFYRLLSEYDSVTQRRLVDRFGKPPDIIAFRPFQPRENDTVAANADEPLKNDVAADAAVAAGKVLQHINDSIRIAQQRKREQQIADSLNLVKQKEQQRIKDSLNNVARLEQVRLRTEDSLRDVQAKKRQQEIADSINLVKQKEQQHIKDSLDNVARLEQIRLRTEDSLRDAQAKKRQQEIADSLNIVKQKEQQRIKDSLDNVAKIRQQQIDDSTLLAQQKKRQQDIADSLNLARQREQQRIKDSLDNVARLEKIRLRTEDSLRDVQARKRQQEIADSLNIVKQKEQQRIKDSLQSVAAANLQKQRTADSLRDAQARKKQQELADSLAAILKQRYNDSLQKAALAKAVPPPTTSSQPAADKALTSRANVLLETYHITSPDILIELFDNGEIDSDRVSVYHNNAIIVSNQTLGIKPITVKIHADAANREHEFVMVAENLGSIPPNSALMRVTAGKQSYKLSVNTDMKTNARIVFYYDGN